MHHSPVVQALALRVVGLRSTPVIESLEGFKTNTDRIAHTTAFVTPVVEHWLEQEIAEWVHPMKGRSDDPSHHERTLYL